MNVGETTGLTEDGMPPFNRRGFEKLFIGIPFNQIGISTLLGFIFFELEDIINQPLKFNFKNIAIICACCNHVYKKIAL